jgi:hypothetical protein
LPVAKCILFKGLLAIRNFYFPLSGRINMKPVAVIGAENHRQVYFNPETTNRYVVRDQNQSPCHRRNRNF